MNVKRKRICILGSTGSIGRTTLRVAGDHPDRFEVVGLSAHRSREALAEQVRAIRPAAACLSGEPLPASTNGATRWLQGAEGLTELLEACEPDLVVSAIVGAAGLEPTVRALDLGIPVALANKEVLVTAGEFVMNLARRRGVRVLPVDSEHNAIFQCLDGRPDDPIRRLILTASGGPFRGWDRARLETATLEDALNHPTWEMGPKITIDSATLMNKGFEVIEGHHLFGLDVGRIEVAIHPQSVVHSMVEFIDGSMLAQLGATDMYFPIAHALCYPERLENRRFEPLDLTRLGALEFEDYDREAFPCLGYAYEAARRGGTWPTALNAANETAVERFLAGELRFTEIAEAIDFTLQGFSGEASADSLEVVREADARARRRAREYGKLKARN